MKIIAIVQARTSSKRLKGKVLKKIKKLTLLDYVYENLKKSKIFYKIIIATSKNKTDNKIVSWCKKRKVEFFRGNLDNVSSRFYSILKKGKFDYFLRVCADSPLLDLRILKKNLKEVYKYEILTNCLKKTYPQGQSIELISKKTYLKKYKYFKKKHHEHVTNFFYENPKMFKIKNLKLKQNLNNVKLSIDTNQDFINIKKIIDSLNKKPYKYGFKKFVSLYKNL